MLTRNLYLLTLLFLFCGHCDIVFDLAAFMGHYGIVFDLTYFSWLKISEFDSHILIFRLSDFFNYIEEQASYIWFIYLITDKSLTWRWSGLLDVADRF
jgi:hypothetical protein